ncbi:M48 family metallopeptidase [Patescibacteria group bacterium]|nr:M48 family metallopeptidase [Patescibacteria group bacterium]
MTHYQLVAKNKRRSFLIVFLFIAFIVGASYVMAKGFGYSLEIVGWALVFSGVTSFFSYFYSDKIILGISGAKEASRKEFFDFYTVTENICMGQKMPMPKLYVIEDSAMNAFATGRNPEHAVVCATTGLLNRLNRSEVEAVVAHEISHVKNYDILLMSIVSILVGLIALLADWFMRMSFWGGNRKRDNDNNQLGAIMAILAIILAILSPIIAQLIQLAISRRREFLADAGSAAISKNPEGLIKALEKISADKEPLESANKATAHLYISNPLKNTKGAAHAFAKLFNTHPPMEERIAALKQMSIK